MLESSRTLAADLAALGAPLVIRAATRGRRRRRSRARPAPRDVYVSRDHAPYGRARDRAVAAALARRRRARSTPKRGLLVHEPEEIATRDGRPYSGLLAVPAGLGATAPPRRSCRRRTACRGHDVDAGRDPDARGPRPRAARPRTRRCSRSRARPPRAAARRAGWRRGVDGYAHDARPAGPRRRHLAAVGRICTSGSSRRSRSSSGPTGAGRRPPRLHQRARLARVLRPRPVPPAARPARAVPAGVRRHRRGRDDPAAFDAWRRAAPATRSSMPRCASWRRPAGCTTAPA